MRGPACGACVPCVHTWHGQEVRWGRRDSNPHWGRFKRPASACWATPPGAPFLIESDTATRMAQWCLNSGRTWARQPGTPETRGRCRSRTASSWFNGACSQRSAHRRSWWRDLKDPRGADAADAVVAGVPTVGEAEPRPLHLVGERLDSRTCPGEDLHHRQVHCPEHEGQLESVTGAEDSCERWGLPIEQVHVRTRPTSHVRCGHLEARPAEDDVRADSDQMSLVSTGSERGARAVRYSSITSSADMSGTASAIHRRMPSSSSAMRAGLPNPNRVSSSLLVPISRSTPAAPPFATAAKGCSGRNTPSTTGRKGSGIIPGSGRRRPISSVAATNSAAGIRSSDCRSHDAFPRRPPCARRIVPRRPQSARAPRRSGRWRGGRVRWHSECQAVLPR